MTYTVDDTMKKLLGAPEAVAVLERFFPKILKNPALQMTAAMTLRQVAGFAQSGLTADSLAEIDAQLRAPVVRCLSHFHAPPVSCRGPSAGYHSEKD